MLIMLLIGMVSRAEAVIVDWASMVSDSMFLLPPVRSIATEFMHLYDTKTAAIRLILGLEKTIVAIILPLVLRLCLELVK